MVSIIVLDGRALAHGMLERRLDRKVSNEAAQSIWKGTCVLLLESKLFKLEENKIVFAIGFGSCMVSCGEGEAAVPVQYAFLRRGVRVQVLFFVHQSDVFRSGAWRSRLWN